jgi:hypothetical protein
MNPEERALEEEKFREELESFYDWRLRFVQVRLGGNASQELRSMAYAGNADESPMRYLPEGEHDYWSRHFYTFQAITFPEGGIRLPFAIISTGVLQEKGGALKYIKLDPDNPEKARAYPIYHYQNETHYDNSTLYLEWLRCTFLAHFIDSTDQSIIDAGLVACLLDDDFKAHRAPEVKQALKEKGATHILIPNTKLGQPHDGNIIKEIKRMLDGKLRSLMAERRVQANEGKEVPRLTERFLMDAHEVLAALTFFIQCTLSKNN